MPYIAVTTNIEITKNVKIDFEKSLGSIIGIFPGKNERYLMTSFNDNVTMTFAGSESACAMISVALYGSATREAYDEFTENVTALLSEKCKIPSHRIYVKYTEHEVFGMNGSNF